MTNANPLLASIENSSVTENGCATGASSFSASVDLFFQIAAMRSRNDEDILSLFYAAFDENREYAVKTLFYARDVRRGQGERRIFRLIVENLAVTNPEVVRANLANIPEFGRWDDLLCLLLTPVGKDALDLIASALRDGNGLAAKWMPREGSSRTYLASMIRNHMGLNPKAYRKLLSGLTKVVETQMCDREWMDIDYSHVPSKAMNIYKSAFARHAPTEWTEFLGNVEAGTAKVNSSVLYPHEVLSGVFDGGQSADEKRMVQAQWDALPNYMIKNPYRILPVIDVSGSMMSGGTGSVTPMDVSVALGAYIADRNNGPFKDYFITFSATPELLKLEGNGICDKTNNLRRTSWGYNTNIEAVFQLILIHAVRNRVSADDMPNQILILSDMEFDAAESGTDETAIETLRGYYANAGYEVPKIVFWNLNAKGNNVPVRFDEDGTALVSGFSPVILTSLLSAEDFTPEGIMFKTILSERYEKVVV